MMLRFSGFLIAVCLTFAIACNSSTDDEKTSDNVEMNDQNASNTPTSQGQAKQQKQTPSSQEQKKQDNPGNQSRNAGNASGQGAVASQGGGTIPLSNKPSDPGNNPFHRIPQCFVNDFVGNMEAKAYQALVGLEYYEDSRVVIFITDKYMVGSKEYERVEGVMNRVSEADNLIFAWVHLGDENEVEFVKKAYSTNLEKRKGKNALILK